MISGSANPWVDRFGPLLDPKEVARRAWVKARPVHGLGDLPIEAACRELRLALEHVFVPTKQCEQILARFVGVALGHSISFYHDAKQFVTSCFERELPLVSVRPICLTGLAGGGKTQLLAALRRVLPADSAIDVDPRHSEFPLISLWSIDVQVRMTLKSMLRRITNLDNCLIEMPDTNHPSDLLEIIRRAAFRCGVPLLTADEFQFVTQSQNANALVTRLLLSLTYLNVPLVFGANYSLLHRLLKRPQEERQRLLAAPIVLLPDRPNSTCWETVLSEYRKVAPAILRFDPKTDAELLHRYSAGLKRLIVNLLEIAYRIARSRGDRTVKRADLAQAYLSAEYSANRQDVELINQQTITGKKVKGRDDLWCPIPLKDSRSIGFAKETEDARGQTVASAMLNSALTNAERKVLQSLRPPATPKRTAKVLPLSKKQKVSAAELLRGAKIFHGQLKDD